MIKEVILTMNKTTLKKRYKDMIIFSCTYLSLFFFGFFSKEISQGIKNGISTSLNMLIPSLFIFMIVSHIIMNTHAKEIIGKPFSWIAQKLFFIPSKYFSIVILSLIGGYPVGAKLLSDAVKRHQLDIQTANRMLCYCVNCGPAFLISAIGVQLLKNINIGIMLYLSQIFASFSIGIILGAISKKNNTIPLKTGDNTPIKSQSMSVALVNAVNDTVRSMAVICGFVVTFSALFPIITMIFQHCDNNTKVILQGILEVVSGSNSSLLLESNHPILLLTFFTAFGGICVHLQICAMLKDSKIKMRAFFITRILYSFISVGFMKIALILSPNTLNCISMNKHPIKIYSVSPISTVFLILLSLMLLFFHKKSDKIGIE